MTHFNPYQAPTVPALADAELALPSPESRAIGGWLILLMIGILASPFILGFALYKTYRTTFTDGSLQLLTTPGSDVYHPMWSVYLGAEIVCNVLSLVLGALLIVLFFRRKKSLPAWYASAVVFSLAIQVLDAAAISWIRPDLSGFDADVTKELWRSVIGGAIWIPYLFYSDRARDTFTR